MKAAIDLNADVGEGFGAWKMGDDEALIAQVSSANIACGFHAGDPLIMARAVRFAVGHGTAIGAHVSYADLRGFGRRHVAVAADELAADLVYQIGALAFLAASAGGRVAYVKPHGALYNELAADAELAAVVVGAIGRLSEPLPLVVLAGSAAVEVATAAGLPCFQEGFPDRGYLADGRLAPRGTASAVVESSEEVARRAVRLATEGCVAALDGSSVRVEVDTLCLHGDSPAAVANARAVRAALEDAGVVIRALVR